MSTEEDRKRAQALLIEWPRACDCNECIAHIAEIFADARAPLEERIADLARERDAAWAEAAAATAERDATVRARERFAEQAHAEVERLRAEIATMRGTARSHDD